MVVIGSFAVAIGCVGGWLGWHSRVKELGTGMAPRGAVRCARHAGEVTRNNATPPAAHGHRIAVKPRLPGIKALMLPYLSFRKSFQVSRYEPYHVTGTSPHEHGFGTA